MTKRQELELRSHDLTDKLNELESAATPDQAAIDAAQTEHREVRSQLRTAIEEEAVEETTETETVDREVRERLELRSRARLTNYLMAAFEGRIPTGVEAEFAAAHGAKAGQIPIDLWEARRPAREERAVTPAPASGLGATLAPIQPFLFAESIAPRLGISMPSVPSGSYSTATITTALPAGPKVKGGAATNTAGVLTPITANPRAIRARMSVAIEDVAQIGQDNFESALMQNTGMAISDEYDKQCVLGDGNSPNINGLLQQLAAVGDKTADVSFALFLAQAASGIDGLWASTLADVAIVMNAECYRSSAVQFRANSSDLSFADYARQNLGAWWCNSRMPAVASNNATCILHRMGRPGVMTAVHPTWGTLSISDIYTDSASGQRHFTIHVLVGDKVLITQPAAYDRLKYKVS